MGKSRVTWLVAALVVVLAVLVPTLVHAPAAQAQLPPGVTLPELRVGVASFPRGSDGGLLGFTPFVHNRGTAPVVVSIRNPIPANATFYRAYVNNREDLGQPIFDAVNNEVTFSVTVPVGTLVSLSVDVLADRQSATSCLPIEDVVFFDVDGTAFEVANSTELECSATCRGRDVTYNSGWGRTLSPDEDQVLLGTPGDDVMFGGDGDDLICGGGGDDHLGGGMGDDVIWGGPGNDLIDGQDGSDRLHGALGDDRLFGGNGDDFIYGYAGDDVISGGAGEDRIHGNFGDDNIDGGPGNDRIFGYGDDDLIAGGTGDDLIGGNFGNDRMNGGVGNDVVYGSDGDDEVLGWLGDDVLAGNSGNDVLNGGEGNDSLNGGIGFDICGGGDGIDSALRCEQLDSVP